MQDVAIRPYEDRDEREVVDLARELQKYESAYYDRLLPPAEIGSSYVLHLLRQARASGGELLVADLGERFIGYATLLLGQTSEEFPEEVYYTWAEIGDLVVSESARNKGIGVVLLKECERRARLAGEKWLRIGAIAANSNAARIYERYGFATKFLKMEKPLT